MKLGWATGAMGVAILMNGALGPLIVRVALSFAGFNKNLPLGAPQGDNVGTALLPAVSWLPALFGLIAVWLLSGYKFTEDDLKSSETPAK